MTVDRVWAPDPIRYLHDQEYADRVDAFVRAHLADVAPCSAYVLEADDGERALGGPSFIDEAGNFYLTPQGFPGVQRLRYVILPEGTELP